jgi:hypothetical protein
MFLTPNVPKSGRNYKENKIDDDDYNNNNNNNNNMPVYFTKGCRKYIPEGENHDYRNLSSEKFHQTYYFMVSSHRCRVKEYKSRKSKRKFECYFTDRI